MDIKDKIIVKDNFFKLKTLNAIKKELSHMYFTNRYNDLKKTKIRSVYQKIYFHKILGPKHFAVEEMYKNLKLLNLKYDTKKTHSAYWLSAKHKKPTPHNDYNSINCLIYLKGNYLVNNGTGFYDKVGDKFILNTHVGFKENRAIIFDPKIKHSSLQFNEDYGTRYLMVNFISY